MIERNFYNDYRGATKHRTVPHQIPQTPQNDSTRSPKIRGGVRVRVRVRARGPVQYG